MKKIYLFIFLIIVGLSQSTAVKAKTSKVINTVAKTTALSYRAGKAAKVTTANNRASKKFGANPVITFAALGTKQFTTTDLTLVATSTATVTTPITYTSSNPAVATVVTALILGAPNGGGGYVNGTYNNVPLTGGSGSGALAQIVVTNNVVTSVLVGVIPSVTVINTVFPALPSGSGYVVGDVLSCAPGFIGGSGSGFNITVAALTPQIHFVSAPAAPNNTTVITASQGGGTAGNATLPADVPNVLTVTPPTISFPTLGTKAYTGQDIPVGASSTVGNKIITYTSSNPAVATINNTTTGTISSGGSGYVSSTYYKVPMLGGSGTGATATITTASNVVTAVTITANGTTPYTIGDVLTTAASTMGGSGSGFTYTVTGYNSNIHFTPLVPASPNNTTVITASQSGGAAGNAGGFVTNISGLVGGALYTNGTYPAVPLTGGSGTGAQATVVVSNGAVSSVVVSNGGTGYLVGDLLSCAASSIGGTGSGFKFNVGNTIALPPDVPQTMTVTAPAITFPPLGTRVLTSVDLNPGATGSSSTTNSISTFGTLTAGTGYVQGTYYSVPLTGGSGTGALATITVTGSAITSVVPTSTGINYVVGDILSAAASNLGGTGSGFAIQVSAVSTGLPITYTSSNTAVATIVNNYIHFVGVGTTTITALQNGPNGGNTSNITPATSATSVLTVTAPVITFPLTNTRPFATTDVNPGATSSLANIPIVYTSSNTSVATVSSNGIASISTLVNGTGYLTTKVYTGVPLTGGSGTGAQASISISPIQYTFVGGVIVSTVYGVTGIAITSAGSGYAIGDVLSCDPANVGGVGSGFNIKVGGVGSFLHFIASGTTNITASQGGGATGTASLPADVVQALTVSPPAITFRDLGNVLISSLDLNPAATSTLANKPITYTISGTGSGSIATITPNSITAFNNPVGGSGYLNNTYAPVPLLGGSGTGAVAQVLVVGGAVTGVTIISGGQGYAQYDVLTADPALIGGGSGFRVTVASAGGVIHFVGAPAAPNNTFTITASQGGGTAGTASLPADVSQVVKVLPYTITYPNLFGTQKLSNTDIVPGATSTYPVVPITYTTDNAAVATIVNGNIHMVGSGTVNIIASQGGGTAGTPTLPADARQTLTVTAAGITFPPLAPAYAVANVEVTPTAVSTLATTPITYSSDNTAVAIITATGTIRIVGVAGTANIKASQGGGAAGTTTLPADVSTPFVVNPAAITFPALGSKVYTDVDFNPGASSTAPSVPITYTSSNPAVATIKTSVAFASPITGGSGYTNGTYTAVPLLVNGASGTITATVIVSGGTVTSVIPAATASIPAGAVVTINPASIGGTGSGFSATSNGTISLIHLTPGTPATPNNTTTITASQSISAGGAPAATSLLTVTAPVLTFPVLASVPYSNVDINPNATSTVTGVPITYTSSNTAVATIVNGQIRIVNIGSADIVATQQNSPVGTLAPATALLPADVKQTLTITSKPAISFTALGSKAYTNTDFAPVVTSTYTNTPITFTSSNTAVATIVNGNIHFVGVGTSTITASQGGGAGGTALLPADATSVLTVTAPTITFPVALGSKALTDIDFAPGATSTITNVPITYSSNNTAVATISATGNIHFVGQGSADITASQTVSSGPAPASATSTLTVTAPTLALAAIGSKPYAVNDLAPVPTTTLTATPVTYTSSNTAVATIVNGNIHFVGLGTANITASQGGGAAGTALLPKDAVQALTVTAPIITFGAIGSKAFSTSDLALAATSTLSLNSPIIYTSSNTAVATIVNNAIHYVGLGSATITASQAAYGGSGPIASVPQALTVTVAVTTFAPALGSKVINSGDVTLAATSTVSTTTYPPVYTTDNANVAIITGGNQLHYVGLGTCNVTATQTIPGNPNYAPAPAIASLTVTAVPAPTAPATPVITFNAIAPVVFTNTADIVPSATSTGTQTITYTSSNPAVATILNGNIHLTPPSIINGVVTYPSPNTTVITASQGGGFGGVPGLIAADKTQTLTVTGAAITFTMSPNSIPFTTNDLAPGATSNFQVISQNNTVVPISYTSSNPAVATIVNNQIHFTGLGATSITASQGNVIVADKSQNIIVTTPVITFPATRPLVFTTTDVPNNATSTVGTLPITYTSSNPAIVSIVNGNLHFNNIGTVTITASQASVGGGVPAPANATQVLTVTGASALTFAATRTQAFTLIDQDPGATSTIATVPITYTSNNPALVSIVNGKLHFNSLTSPVTVSNTAIITATQAATAGIPAQTASQVLTVTQGIVIQNPLTKFYGDADFSPGVSSLGSGYPVTYTSATTGTATTVTNGIAASPGQQVHIVTTGTSILTASQLGDVVNVAATAVPCTLTVVASPMTITPKNVTAVYGTPLISFPVGYEGFRSPSGTVDDSTKFTAQPIVNILGRTPNGFYGNIPVGTYTLTASGAASALYTFNYGKGTLTITPAVQTLSWATWNGTHAIGDADFDPLARSTGDPVSYTSSNTAVATISGISTLATPTGGSAYANNTYTGVPLTGGSGSGAIATIVVANGAVTTVTITTAGSNYAIGDVLTASATSIGGAGSGFSVNVKSVISMLHIVGVGTSTITAKLVPTSGNYTGTGTLTQTLTVGPGAQTITVATIPYLNKGSAPYTPNATASSGLPVTVVSSDPTIVKVVGQTIVPVHVGTATLTFSQAGNASYSAAPNVAQFVQVVDPSGSIVKVDQAVSPNGDGINDFLYIEGLQNYPVNHVKIVNRNGTIVYEADGYNNKDIAFNGRSSHNGKLVPEGTYFYLIEFNTGSDKNNMTGYFVLKY